MSNSKMTRRALLTSVMALMLCFAMLTGTTFAWFTDQETSANNKIIAGNLDVDFLMYYEGSYQSIKDINKPIFGAGSIAQNNNMETLWEPGKTQVAFLAIENAGSLALKYNVYVDVEDYGLAAALEYAIVPVKADEVELTAIDWNEIKTAAAAVSATNYGDLPVGRTIAAKGGCLDEIVNGVGNETDYFALAIHMKESAGNAFADKSVTIDISVVATQVEAEDDSFDNTYDEVAPLLPTDTIIFTDALPEQPTAITLGGGAENTVTVTFPANVAFADDATELYFIMYLAESGNETAPVEEGDKVLSYIIDIPAIAPTNNVPVTVAIEYEVPAGKTVKAVYRNGAEVDFEYEDGVLTLTSTFADAVSSFALARSATPDVFEFVIGEVVADVWDGTADVSWYNDTDTEFALTTAEQLAGFRQLVDGGETFAGKTVKLDADIDLYLCPEGAEEPVSFDPIGYGYDVVFKGTFDGQGHTISNLYQSGWALGYQRSTAGGGLFASVVDATIKNLTIDNAVIEMNCIDMGIVVGYSYGTTCYENILVTNSAIGNYQRYTGGVVGEVNGTQTFINVDVKDTVVAALWGDFDTSVGGIIGGKWGACTVYMKDCDVECVIDAFNDATSANEWHAYRRAGMLIGNSEETATVNGRTSATASYLTAENCTVTYGDWMNYTYCEFSAMQYPWVRVQEGYAHSAYSNPRTGHPTDAAGNVVVDDNHVHNDGEGHLDPHVFNQLYGGGTGVYGTATHEGVTIVYPASYVSGN